MTAAAFIFGCCLALGADAPNAAADSRDVLVRQGTRHVLDLGGTWEARAATFPVTWPPPGDGWKPQVVPHSETALIDSDEIGPYFPQLAKVVDAQGKSLKPDKAAAWFRRHFTLASPPTGMRALLRCDGIAWRSDVFVNGRPVGSSVLGLVANVHDVTSALRKGDNELAIGVSGRVALWNQEKGCFAAPIAGVMPGIYDRVRLEFVPETRIDDVFVRTSVVRRRLEIDVELVNLGRQARTVTPRATIIDPLGTAQIECGAPAVAIPAGGRVKTTLGADWLAEHLWSHGAPNLHVARVDLVSGGTLIDAVDQTFGYREFTAKGRDFMLNGRRQVLLRNSWLSTAGSPRERMLNQVHGETTHYNSIRLHLGFNNPHVMQQADSTGIMIIPEFWAWYDNSDTRFPIAKAEHWLPNAAETMRRVVRRHRNHPSVVMWSLANETMWDSTTPERMAVCEKLVNTVRAEDPTRLLQGDAEITWGDRLDITNIHYPEGDITNELGTRYNNSGWIVPNQLDWLKKDGSNHSWRANFVWDRPLVIGEFYARDGDEPERYTSYAGDASYDRTLWRWQDLGGKGALMPKGGPWIDMVKMTCDHYRAAGVAGLNPWTGIGAQTMPPFLVAPLDHFPNAFGGESSPRRFVVINDHFTSYNDIHVQAGLLIDGREVWSERHIPANVNPGESKQLTISIRPPPVTTRQHGRLIVRLCWMRGPEPYELNRHEEDLWIMPRPSLAGADAGAVALIDRADGVTARALATLGLKVVPGRGDDAALAGKRLLVIGEGAASQADLSAAARFAGNGGQVLVLHQTELPAFVPFQPEIDVHHAASFSWRQATHPALEGLDDGQLRFWRPNHLVVTETFVRPSVGAAASVTACGGRYGMHWSPLIDLRHGKGALAFCQYPLAERVGEEPAAGTMLANAVRSALSVKAAKPAMAMRLAPGVDKEARSVLAATLVRTSDGLTGTGPVLLDARTPPDAPTLKRLRSETEAGGNIWLRGLDKDSVRNVAVLLPWVPGFTDLPKDVLGATRRDSTTSILAGIGSGDLYWARGGGGGKATTPLGGPVVVPPNHDAAVQLTEPALLLAVPVGMGCVLIDQFAWDTALAAETERCTRLVSALARNLGAGFNSPADASQRYRFTSLDLSQHANRGYMDKVANDGKGGWTDQGEQDMRFFLINHTGEVGGMAVAVSPFPTEVSFHGIPYRLIDPKSSGSKSSDAVLVLRGAGNDLKCPAEVRGIRVGKSASRIWFLHTAVGVAGCGDGATIARYEMVFTDGTRAVVPVRLGQEIGDWCKPKPLPGAQVAWTGSNAKTPLLGIFTMAWDNPSPSKTIASIDVIGNLAETQLVLFGITLGEESGANGRTVAAWDCGRFTAGQVPSSVGTGSLDGTGKIVTLGNRSALRFAGGQNLTGQLNAGPLADGKPMAVEVEVSLDGPPGDYCGGLFEAGSYMNSGMRMTVGRDLRVSVENWAGPGAPNASNLKSLNPLSIGRLTTVRFEHTGKEARLLIDGQLQEVKACSPPKAYKGGIRIGLAAGKNYFLNGVIAGIRVLALEGPPSSP
ncbi:MAG: glycoside hydrolase family 2 TIM barrel-domain containing protein [Luteolibacter sp.]|jgi:beta-galactosidase|nr:glycoside hydrolase family 2 TIM barrel-domain containing protein [Luteolibacter sp.]